MLNLNSIIVFFLFLLVSCKNLSLEPVPKFHSVDYEVTGTAISVSIEMIDEWGSDSNISEVSIPWSYFYSTKRKSGTPVYLSATKLGRNGTVIVTILRDSIIFISDSSFSAYGTATVSGNL